MVMHKRSAEAAPYEYGDDAVMGFAALTATLCSR